MSSEIIAFLRPPSAFSTLFRPVSVTDRRAFPSRHDDRQCSRYDNAAATHRIAVGKACVAREPRARGTAEVGWKRGMRSLVRRARTTVKRCTTEFIEIIIMHSREYSPTRFAFLLPARSLFRKIFFLSFFLFFERNNWIILKIIAIRDLRRIISDYPFDEFTNRFLVTMGIIKVLFLIRI